MFFPSYHRSRFINLGNLKTRYTYNLSMAMMMNHVFTCILFVLMFSASTAAFMATLPSGYNTANLQPCIKYSIVHCPDLDYNSTTGVFTATTNGSYIVSVTMMTGLVAGHVTLKRNTVIYVWLYTGNGYDMGTQVICIYLVIGDTIAVDVVNPTNTLFDVYNTFSAVRVPP